MFRFQIGDIRDKEAVNEACKNVDFVFHAAALKQVPSCEFYPLEAVKTNIIGTNNILEGCFDNNVKKIVCLSTDKAVYPINAMGMSKALMEKIAISKSKNFKKSKTQVTVTRYGNVLFSRGSILPLLINKINKNEPITITDFNMTRFLMTLDSAIDLVLFALKSGKNGQIIIPETYATSIKSEKTFNGNNQIKAKDFRYASYPEVIDKLDNLSSQRLIKNLFDQVKHQIYLVISQKLEKFLIISQKLILKN